MTFPPANHRYAITAGVLGGVGWWVALTVVAVLSGLV